MVFSARKKLRRLCSAVNQRKDKEENSDRNRCQVKHVKRFVTCVKGAVYLIPFSCGRSYIGQTGRCLNIRLREHHSSLKGTAYSHLAMHCRDCGCEPCFTDTTVLFQHIDQTSREIVEAYHITKNRSSCVSQPSLTLTNSEMHFLDLG